MAGDNQMVTVMILPFLLSWVSQLFAWFYTDYMQYKAVFLGLRSLT